MRSNFSINKAALHTALIVGSSFFMVMLDSTIIATSLPPMAADFGVSVLDFSLGVSAFFLALAAFVPAAGWCADRFGARRVFLASIIIFTLASWLCAQATEFYFFIFARALQGLGGALMTPVGRMMILQLSQKHELSRAMNMLTWPALSAPVLGPVLGGFITTYFNWRWNFYINLPLGALALLLTLRYIPHFEPAPKRPFDALGFGLSAGGLIGLLYGLESFAHGWSSTPTSFMLLVVGVCFLIAAIRHFSRTAHPLLDLAPLRIPTFALATVHAGTFQRVGLNATPFVLPLLFQVGFGMTPVQAGGYVMAYFCGNLTTKAVSPQILSWLGFRRLLFINGLLCGVSIAAVGLLTTQGAVATVLVLFFAGMVRSLQFSAINTLTFADIEGPLRSSAAPLSALSMHFSATLGVALTVLIVHLSTLTSRVEQVRAWDFQLALCFLGLTVFGFSFLFLRLSASAGRDVTRF